ncbi:MAG: decaprenyl-phosphate phosphoribosyltransferase [candidate division Zixibacteria bacterium]|nr:decaprenyl-phosphate phosphoribosyltransferase [candidate division Zixibacteria bacterium]
MIAVALWRSLRPTHWVKNLVVFAGLIFARHFDRVADVERACGAFAVFCALASAVYLFNDIRDRESDRAHPEKQKRPIAAGTLPVRAAAVCAVTLAAAGLAGAAALGRSVLVTAAAYALLNVAYSVVLKRLAIIDVMIVALGFVLRAVGGAEAIGVAISPWLIVCTILLALFLGFGKRRWELVALGDDAASHRAALAGYSPHLLDQLIAVTTASTVVAYALYTLSADTQAKFGTDQLIWTLPFVLYGVFRYLYLIHGAHQGGNPTTVLLRDAPMLANAILWLIAVLVIITRH